VRWRARQFSTYPTVRLCADSIFTALEATGYDVVCTQGSTQAMAMKYIMHSVVTVVLHRQMGDQSSFDAAKSLRAFCPSLPIILLCHDKLDSLPSYVDACVCTGQSLETFISEVQSLLSAKKLLAHSTQC
jgi:DNA-binding response OmpR family regulator